jgi:hypothetical protein
MTLNSSRSVQFKHVDFPAACFEHHFLRTPYLSIAFLVSHATMAGESVIGVPDAVRF